MKRILSLILALSLLLTGMIALVACGDGEGGDNNGENAGGDNNGGDDAVKVDYSLTVVDQNDDGVAGIEVTFKVGPKTSYNATTDDNGKATISIEETTLPIRASIPAQLPGGYATSEASYVDFASGSKSATIEVIKNIAHTVYVKDANGNAVSGANVQVCVDGVCQVAQMTDAEGKAIFYVNPEFEEAYAQFNTVSGNYEAPETVKIYYVDGETVATFTVTAK